MTRYWLTAALVCVALLLGHVHGGSSTTGTVHSSSSAVAVVNTTTETTVYSFTLAPSTLKSFGRLRVSLRGHVSTVVGLSPTFRCHFGTAFFAMPLSLPKSVVSAPVFIELDVTGSGSAGTQTFHCRYIDTSGAVGTSNQVALYATSTIDTNASQVFKLTWQWDAALAASSFVADSVFTEMLQ